MFENGLELFPFGLPMVVNEKLNGWSLKHNRFLNHWVQAAEALCFSLQYLYYGWLKLYSTRFCLYVRQNVSKIFI